MKLRKIMIIGAICLSLTACTEKQETKKSENSINPSTTKITTTTSQSLTSSTTETSSSTLDSSFEEGVSKELGTNATSLYDDFLKRIAGRWNYEVDSLNSEYKEHLNYSATISNDILEIHETNDSDKFKTDRLFKLVLYPDYESLDETISIADQTSEVYKDDIKNYDDYIKFLDSATSWDIPDSRIMYFKASSEITGIKRGEDYSQSDKNLPVSLSISLNEDASMMTISTNTINFSIQTLKFKR